MARLFTLCQSFVFGTCGFDNICNMIRQLIKCEECVRNKKLRIRLSFGFLILSIFHFLSFDNALLSNFSTFVSLFTLGGNGLRIGDGGAFEKRQPNICTNAL